MAGAVLYKHAARCAGRIAGAIWSLHGRPADLVQQQSLRRVPGDRTGIATSGGRLSVLTVTPPWLTGRRDVTWQILMLIHCGYLSK